MSPPRALTRSAAKARKRSDDAPRHCGSLGGKYIPISPSASAPSTASVSACSTTSPSEWASDAPLGRDPHPAEPDVVAVGEGMNVEPRADAHDPVSARPAETPLGGGEIRLRA